MGERARFSSALDSDGGLGDSRVRFVPGIEKIERGTITLQDLPSVERAADEVLPQKAPGDFFFLMDDFLAAEVRGIADLGQFHKSFRNLRYFKTKIEGSILAKEVSPRSHFKMGILGQKGLSFPRTVGCDE